MLLPQPQPLTQQPDGIAALLLGRGLQRVGEAWTSRPADDLDVEQSFIVPEKLQKSSRAFPNAIPIADQLIEDGFERCDLIVADPTSDPDVGWVSVKFVLRARFGAFDLS